MDLTKYNRDAKLLNALRSDLDHATTAKEAKVVLEAVGMIDTKDISHWGFLIVIGNLRADAEARVIELV